MTTKNSEKTIAQNPVLQVSDRFYLYTHLDNEFRLPNYSYVGKEKQTNELCGTFKSEKHDIHSCECGKTHHIQGLSCKKLGCPICVKDSSYNRAIRITERVMYGMEFNDCYAYHVSLNISKRQELLALAFGVERFEKEIVIPYIKERFEGSIMILHPDRINDDKNIREFSLHWHLIALTKKKWAFSQYDKENMRKDKKYSFVVKFHKNKRTNRFQMSEYDDIFAVAGYQLSHSAYKKNSIAYRGFGNLSGSKLRVRKEFINYVDEPLECSECGSPLYEVSEYEVDTYHYSPLVKRKIEKLERMLIVSNHLSMSQIQILEKLKELKELMIVDSILVKKLNKDHQLYCRKIDNIIIPKGTPAINYNTVKWKTEHDKKVKERDDNDMKLFKNHASNRGLIGLENHAGKAIKRRLNKCEISS